MTEFFIGFAIGLYIMGVLIVGFMKGMGGDSKSPSAFLWPITYIISIWRG